MQYKRGGKLPLNICLRVCGALWFLITFKKEAERWWRGCSNQRQASAPTETEGGARSPPAGAPSHYQRIDEPLTLTQELSTSNPFCLTDSMVLTIIQLKIKITGSENRPWKTITNFVLAKLSLAYSSPQLKSIAKVTLLCGFHRERL